MKSGAKGVVDGSSIEVTFSHLPNTLKGKHYLDIKDLDRDSLHIIEEALTHFPAIYFFDRVNIIEILVSHRTFDFQDSETVSLKSEVMFDSPQISYKNIVERFRLNVAWRHSVGFESQVVRLGCLPHLVAL